MKQLALFAASCLLLTAAAVPPVAGDWQGTISFAGVDQKLAFHCIFANNAFTGTVDAVNSGIFGIPARSIVFADTKLTFAVPQVAATYEGTFDAKTELISGTWSQNGVNVALNLRRMTAADRPNRPQEPKPPYPYISENVKYDNPQAPGVHLAGTLTKPKGDGPFRTVLLITGSGPQNRDEELMRHKPFLVLADYLTRRGTAVLRVDDRGVGESTGNFATATTYDFATDTMAGVRYLLGRPDVDKKHIGLIGHSEGGVVAPMVAVKMPEVAFVVMLAGTALPGAEIIEDQVYQANILAGSSPEVSAANRALEHKILAAIIDNPDPDKKVLALAEGNPGLEQKLQHDLLNMKTPWYRYFLSYDPRNALQELKCPVLALNGSKDSQVNPDLNLPAIREALRKAGNKDATVQLVPGVNHLFQTAKTGAVAEYREIEETISPKVLEIVADWIAKH